MIVRMWRARSTAGRAGDYVEHATKIVFPKLQAIPGHRGQSLLRREVQDGVEFVVLTFWESMEAVLRFAGTDANTAVVEPEARAALTSYDEYATHYEVVDENDRQPL